MKPAHAVVGGWAAANLALALILLAFRPGPLELMIHIIAAALIAGFGSAVLLAVRAGRVGPQQRQPRRASAAVFAALGVALGLTGLAYGWWLSALGLYPLGLAAWLVRGERLPQGTRPWPVALDGAPPGGPPHLVHHGSSIGVSVAVPAEHPAHGPPPPPPASRPVRIGVVLVLLVSAARAVVNVLRRGRRG
jgi:hypothetical protein